MAGLGRAGLGLSSLGWAACEKFLYGFKAARRAARAANAASLAVLTGGQ
jgi:hypothetical protein